MVLNKRITVLIGIAIAVLYVLFSTTGMVTDYYWFKSMNAEGIFWTILNTKVMMWFGVFITYFSFLYLNLWIALRSTRNQRFQLNAEFLSFVDINKIINTVIFLASFVLAFISAGPGADIWDDFLQFSHSTAFQIKDPVFHKDIGFYFFTLPFLVSIKNLLLGLVVETLLASCVIYFFKGSIQLIRGWYKNFGAGIKKHLGSLVVLFLTLLALHFFLLKFELLYSRTGVVYGAGYTDVHTRLFGYYAVSFICFSLIFPIIHYMFSESYKPVVISFGLFVVLFILFVGIIPAFQQKFIVEPYELEKEREYIKNSLKFTRKAYGLDKVEKQEYNLDNTLTRKDLHDNRITLQNIRLWDWRPLLSTYRQLQELRMYYTFDDVDIDRYKIGDDYRQLMLSVRELDYSQMPPKAQTWVNQRLRYTHGYGIVASPVDMVTREGMPDLLIKDIPPSSPKGLEVDRPGIYFGEKTNDYIFTGTSMDEFDYPLGEKNQHTRYNGKGGVPIKSFWKRLLYAIDNQSIKIMISEYFTKDTRIIYNRNILKLAQKIAPFLNFDSDPYIAIIDGKLKWFIDAYTTGSKYPYAEPVQHNINYIRNSVKVVIDAYDGTADFYVIDANDPVIKTYEKIFPGFFKKSSEIPEEIRKHFRYPIDLFIKQSSIFLAYHMNEPEVFYNREDLWKFPREVYEGREEMMSPYFTIMQLNSSKAEFLLILPFTPAIKNNMIAWLSAGSDGSNYGKITLFEFPKKELVFGPMQIEARIDQTPEISEVLTLWNQQGSSVIRGNLLVIPINHTLLYIEPLYLQAEKSRMPELKRVVVAYKNDIIMKPTLEEALEAIFNISHMPGKNAIETESNLKDLINQAVSEFQMGRQSMQKGNWSEYGDHQKEVERLLREIQQKAPK